MGRKTRKREQSASLGVEEQHRGDGGGYEGDDFVVEDVFEFEPFATDDVVVNDYHGGNNVVGDSQEAFFVHYIITWR